MIYQITGHGRDQRDAFTEAVIELRRQGYVGRVTYRLTQSPDLVITIRRELSGTEESDLVSAVKI